MGENDNQSFRSWIYGRKLPNTIMYPKFSKILELMKKIIRILKTYTILISVGCILSSGILDALPIYELNTNAYAPAKESRSQLSIKVQACSSIKTDRRADGIISVNPSESCIRFKDNFVTIIPPPYLVTTDANYGLKNSALETSANRKTYFPSGLVRNASAEDYKTFFNINGLVFNLMGGRTFQQVIHRINTREVP